MEVVFQEEIEKFFLVAPGDLVIELHDVRLIGEPCGGAPWATMAGARRARAARSN